MNPKGTGQLSAGRTSIFAPQKRDILKRLLSASAVETQEDVLSKSPGRGLAWCYTTTTTTRLTT